MKNYESGHVPKESSSKTARKHFFISNCNFFGKGLRRSHGWHHIFGSLLLVWLELESRNSAFFVRKILQRPRMTEIGAELMIFQVSADSCIFPKSLGIGLTCLSGCPAYSVYFTYSLSIEA